MSNKKAREKTLDASSNVPKSVWIKLAEDAESDAKKAIIRSKQLKEAAKIFRDKDSSGEPWPGTQTV